MNVSPHPRGVQTMFTCQRAVFPSRFGVSCEPPAGGKSISASVRPSSNCDRFIIDCVVSRLAHRRFQPCVNFALRSGRRTDQKRGYSLIRKRRKFFPIRLLQRLGEVYYSLAMSGKTVCVERGILREVHRVSKRLVKDLQKLLAVGFGRHRGFGQRLHHRVARGAK